MRGGVAFAGTEVGTGRGVAFVPGVVCPVAAATKPRPARRAGPTRLTEQPEQWRVGIYSATRGARRASGEAISVTEVASRRDQERHLPLVGGRDHFLIANRSAGRDDRGDA